MVPAEPTAHVKTALPSTFPTHARIQYPCMHRKNRSYTSHHHAFLILNQVYNGIFSFPKKTRNVYTSFLATGSLEHRRHYLCSISAGARHLHPWEPYDVEHTYLAFPTAGDQPPLNRPTSSRPTDSVLRSFPAQASPQCMLIHGSRPPGPTKTIIDRTILNTSA